MESPGADCRWRRGPPVGGPGARRCAVVECLRQSAVYLPGIGRGPSGTTLAYRVFSNRPDANHRYMIDPAVRDQMVAKGWLAEGDGPDQVVMCAPA